jgi:hypothetical protein
VRNFQLQHQDRDEDGDDAVAEGFEAVFTHFFFLLALPTLLLDAAAVARQDLPATRFGKTPYARVSEILLKRYVVECPADLHPY